MNDMEAALAYAQDKQGRRYSDTLGLVTPVGNLATQFLALHAQVELMREALERIDKLSASSNMSGFLAKDIARAALTEGD